MDKIYKREDFDIKNSGLGVFISVSTDDERFLDRDLYIVKIWVDTKKDIIENCYFPSKTQAKKAIRKFLDKQNKPEDIEDLDIFKASPFTYENAKGDSVKVKLTLNVGDKLTVERKREKVFSLDNYLKDATRERLVKDIRRFDIRDLALKTESELKDICFITYPDWMIDQIK